MTTNILWLISKILFIIISLILVVAYYTYAERKVIGYMQDRIGPNRVGYLGLLQPITDAVKLFLKEIITPEKSNHYLFFIAPVLSFAPAYAAWAVVPFGGEGTALSNIDTSVLYILVMVSLGVHGIVIAGWSSNSKYAMFGSLRAAAQVISYELSMGLSIVGVLIAAGSMNLNEIINAQKGGIWQWYFIPLLPLFVIYFISGVAETGRAPFDVIEGESEIVAGYHVEYSGSYFALFFLAEYASMILVSMLTAIFFLGGWLSPFEGIPVLNRFFYNVPGVVWLLLKTGFFMFIYLWIRATYPRYRYDQLMRLGWKVFIPIALFWVVIVALMVKLKFSPWWI